MIGLETIGSWTVTIIVGIGAGLSTQVVSWWRDASKDKKLQRRVATYLALRVAVILEAFAIACDDLINENQRAQRPEDSEEGPRKTLPDLEPFPNGVDWRVLDLSLTNRALAFRNDLAVSDNALRFEWDIYNKPQSDACDDEAAKRGAQAWDLACDLRGAYQIPEYHPGFGVRSRLQAHTDRVNAAEKEAKAAAQTSLDELIPSTISKPNDVAGPGLTA